MCIVFTCGEHSFRREVEGYEGLICRCYNCGNYSGHVIKTHPWFTFCFVPVLPLSFHGYEDINCHICNFSQPLESRQDVQAMRHGGAGGRPGVPLQPHPVIPEPPHPVAQQPPHPEAQQPPHPEAQQPPAPNGNMRYG